MSDSFEAVAETLWNLKNLLKNPTLRELIDSISAKLKIVEEV